MLREALAADVEMIEVDLWFRAGRIEARHELRVGWLAVLADKRRRGPTGIGPWAVPLPRGHYARLDLRSLLLPELLQTTGGTKRLLLDVKAVDAGPAEEFAKALAPLPDGVVLQQGNRGRRADMAIWFTASARQMERRFSAVAKAVGEGTLWVSWPKRSSGVSTDLNEDEIRRVALDRGMVDTKVCAIDEIWSGLRLTRRRS